MNDETKLHHLSEGECATVVELARGDMHRRLLDIGLTEGAKVRCTCKSPSGNLSAYLIQGAVVALRREDAELVSVAFEKSEQHQHQIALAGKPNVGKSTLFNALTGLRQHTGNWAGKTVENKSGYAKIGEHSYRIWDLPGIYSLRAGSAEEETARDFICSGIAEATVVVCDATCLERSLCLVLQALEITENVLVCVNLIDEAERRGILINGERLSELLGVPVIKMCARKKKSVAAFGAKVEQMQQGAKKHFDITYTQPVERAISTVMPAIPQDSRCRFTAVGMLSGEIKSTDAALPVLENALKALEQEGIMRERIPSVIASCTALCAEWLASECAEVRLKTADAGHKIDRVLSNRLAAYPLMAALLALIFWITLKGANYPSQVLSQLLSSFEGPMLGLLSSIHLPAKLCELLVLGAYRVLAQVVSVMLPPMAIFFPMFTFLEDLGYLPRVAFNLDGGFKKCKACGKQALTMCMGFGCNAAAVVGARIIDSKRERLIAILTNSLVPCNGRFPTMLVIISVFLAGSSRVLGASWLFGMIVFGVAATFLMSWLLSHTILRGQPSSFTLELPPYRIPQAGKIIVRSVIDRTLHVLARAAAVAAPAGAVIWIMANVYVGGASILQVCANFLDPVGRFMGLDGVIVLAFVLCLPANEIFLPIVIMGYMAGSSLGAYSTEALGVLLRQNGWTALTAINVMIFSLLHWPCATTLLSIKKESGGVKWAALAAVLPTALGILVCTIVALLWRAIV